MAIKKKVATSTSDESFDDKVAELNDYLLTLKPERWIRKSMDDWGIDYSGVRGIEFVWLGDKKAKSPNLAVMDALNIGGFTNSKVKSIEAMLSLAFDLLPAFIAERKEQSKNKTLGAAILKFSGPYAFLSNFYPTDVDDCATLEHAYQAAKTDDLKWKTKIIRASTPGEAKKLGRKAPMVSNWDDIKVTTMAALLEKKFPLNRSNDLSKRLLETGDRILVEGNNWKDYFWGVCQGVGQNMLGRLLMARRAYLRSMFNDY